MEDYLFLFDLDSTITKIEILPTIAESIGCGDVMRELTEKNMYQAIPFRRSFLDRVELLKELPVSEVSQRIAEIPLHEDLVRFLQDNKEHCYIVTGNLDVWIDGLVKRIGMEGNVFCSKGIVKNDRLVGVASVIDKNSTVEQFVGPFVAVGDGSNDAEMISKAGIGIGFGGVRPIAPSVLEVATHAFYNERALVRFLERLSGKNAPEKNSKTVVISCAGMGKRLGIGSTKCLVEIDGESLISRHLRQLDDVDDVRIVVGYQAEKVISAALACRDDVTFVFNHDFAHNGTGASVALAAKHANKRIITLDGDLLVHPSDMSAILSEEDEFVGVTSPGTDNPVLTTVENGLVVGFGRGEGSFEWTGIAQIESERIGEGDGHVYQLIEPNLPMKYLLLRTKEIDTPNDYDNAVRWVHGGYSDEIVIGVLGGMGTYATVDLFRRIADAIPAEKEWDRPRILIDNYCTMPSRVRAILYGEKRWELAEMLAKSTSNLINAGCTHILYACNTSHVFHEDVCSLLPEARGYLVDMIDLLAKDMNGDGIKKAFLLASEGTIQTGIYQERFAPYGIEIVPADGNRQAELREFIEAVKQNKATQDVAKHFGEYLVSLEEKTLILGCTELPVLFGSYDCFSVTGLREIDVYDPIQSAINELVEAHIRARFSDQLTDSAN